MRPRPSLVAAAAVAFVAAVLAVALPALPDGLAAAVWLALAGVAIGDLIVSPVGRGVTPGLSLPSQLDCGQPARLVLTLERAPPPGAAVTLEMPEGIDHAGPVALTGRETAIAIRPRRRGHHPIPRLWLCWPSRLGLWDIVCRHRTDAVLRVAPATGAIRTGAIARQVAAGLRGERPDRMPGEGAEFHQLRDYQPGMDPRRIDWKRSARRRRLLAKETRAERNQQVMLVLDRGHLMAAEIDGLARLDHAIHAALALAWAAALAGDLVGLASYASAPGRVLRPAPGRRAFGAIRAECAALTTEAAESNPVWALADLGAALQRRTLVVVLTELVDPTAARLSAEMLAHLSRTHLVLMVALGDPGLSRRVDGPTADPAAAAEAVVAARMLADRRRLFRGLERAGVMVLDTSPDRLSGALIGRYLDIKRTGRL